MWGLKSVCLQTAKIGDLQAVSPVAAARLSVLPRLLSAPVLCRQPVQLRAAFQPTFQACGRQSASEIWMHCRPQCLVSQFSSWCVLF